jgi:hypothetical protein
MAEATAVLVIRSDGSDTGVTSVLDDQGRVQTVDLADGRVRASSDALAAIWEGPTPGSFDIAPDQSTAVVSFLGLAAGYVDIASGRLIAQLSGLSGAAYDGESRLHVFQDGMEWSVDRESGELVSPHPADVEFSPPPVLSADGQVAVTGGQTGTVSLLSLDGRGTVFGRIVVPVEAHRFAVSAFTPDGTALITAIQSMAELNRSATVRRLDLRREAWVASACALAGRDLTADEWRSYVGTEPPGDLRCRR